MKRSVFTIILLSLVSGSSLCFGSSEIKTKVQTVWTGDSPSLGQGAKKTYKKQPSIRAIKHPSGSAGQSPKVKTQGVGKKETPASVTNLNPYWVQVGAFSSESNAHRLAARLKAIGYHSQLHLTKNLDHRVLYLVLIGDFAHDKAALELAEDYSLKQESRAVVVRDGAVIRVFNPLPPLVVKDKVPRIYAKPGEKDPLLVEPPDSIYTPTKQPEAKYSFSVGGLYKHSPAKKLARELRKKGYRPRLSKRKDINQLDWWYVVEIGNFFTKTDAESAATVFFEREHLMTEVNIP